MLALLRKSADCTFAYLTTTRVPGVSKVELYTAVQCQHVARSSTSWTPTLPAIVVQGPFFRETSGPNCPAAPFLNLLSQFLCPLLWKGVPLKSTNKALYPIEIHWASERAPYSLLALRCCRSSSLSKRAPWLILPFLASDFKDSEGSAVYVRT